MQGEHGCRVYLGANKYHSFVHNVLTLLLVGWYQPEARPDQQAYSTNASAGSPLRRRQRHCLEPLATVLNYYYLYMEKRC